MGDRSNIVISRVFSRDEFLALADESSWRVCDPFSMDHDRDSHDWPFEPFLREAPGPERADRVRDTKWPQLLYSEYGEELSGT